MVNKFLILIDGPMGSGKTTTSKLLNQKLPDTARVALPDIKRLVPSYKENKEAMKVIREVMNVMVDKYLEHGVSVILEHITKTEGVEMFREIAEEYGANLYVYRLSAPKELHFIRVSERTKEMMEVSELPKSKVNELIGYFESNDKFYIDNPLDSAETINTKELSPDQVVEIIIKKLP